MLKHENVMQSNIKCHETNAKLILALICFGNKLNENNENFDVYEN